MGGLDKMDKIWSYYGVGRNSSRYWKHILFNIFYIATINSFILFKQNNPTNCQFSLNNVCEISLCKFF